MEVGRVKKKGIEKVNDFGPNSRLDVGIRDGNKIDVVAGEFMMGESVTVESVTTGVCH